MLVGSTSLSARMVSSSAIPSARMISRQLISGLPGCLALPIGRRLLWKLFVKTRLMPSDSPWLGSHALILRENVANGIFGAMLREEGELLPLDCPGAQLVIYNPTHVVDALDEAISSVSRLADGRIWRIQKYEFREDLIKDFHAFKIPQLRVSPTFVSQRFVDLWRASNLKGLDFNCVWKSS
jgi:hypothetical protein